MHCTRCGGENGDGKKFCGDCGAPVAARETAVPVPGEPGAYYCARHRKEPTRVTCGRCETPVCTRCAVAGPVGVRCRECARSRVPLRPLGVLHGAGQQLDRGTGRTVWYLAVWYFIVSIVSNLFGGFGGRDS
ncbi:MAG TPA: hypothetical protein VK689_08565 [Armatimonadota bacterium]|nr:hypothetical protein [Armatimonadota bacterium]